MKASLFFAVENYADKNFPERKYAAADAREFAAVLEQHGFAPADREILIDEKATKTSIESVIRTTLKRLTKNDTLYFYYAGHGFSAIGGDNYITCGDTRPTDLEHTSMSLNWLIQQFKASPCKRIVMFLDSCSTLLESEEWRANYSDLNDVELKEFFESAEYSVCLTACRSGEYSHPSSALKHCIWAYHIIQAFEGQNPIALDGYRLTKKSLQKYLEIVVPPELRKTNPQAVQTPQIYGAASSEFQLANLQDILANRQRTSHPQVGQVRESILLAESIMSVKTLAGFKKGKGHFLPDRHSASAQSFISELARDDIKDGVETVRAALKTAFGFKRLQLTVENHAGAATITTPYFNYNVSVAQDPADVGNVVWRRSVDAIIDPDKVLSDEFERVFADVFDTVELSLRDEVDIEPLIDFIESLGSDDIAVEYAGDEGVTSCVVRIKGHDAAIEVTSHTFAVVHPRAKSPKLLVKSLFDIQLALTHKHSVQLIPFKTSS